MNLFLGLSHTLQAIAHNKDSQKNSEFTGKIKHIVLYLHQNIFLFHQQILFKYSY